jgi:hypothetical protein
MLAPFDPIIKAPKWELCPRAYWGIPSIDVSQCIADTAKQYGAGEHMRASYIQMLRHISRGGQYSVIGKAKDPKIIESICAHFPKLVDKTTVDYIVGCIAPSTYPLQTLRSIQATGYEFDQKQLQLLNDAGYAIQLLVKSMTIDQLILLYDNPQFADAFYDGLALSDEVVKSKEKILQDIITPHQIIPTTQLANRIIRGYAVRKEHSLAILASLYCILSRISCKPDIAVIIELIRMNRIFCNKSNHTATKHFAYTHLSRVLGLYGVKVTRDMVLGLIEQHHVFKMLVHPEITQYNPIPEIHMLLANVHFPEQYIEHLLEHKYLDYQSDVFVSLISSGYDPKGLHTAEYLRHTNNVFPDRYVQKMFCLGTAKSIDMLVRCKITPTFDLVRLSTSIDVLRGLVGARIYTDEQTDRYIETMCDKSARWVGDANVNDKDYLDICDSLSESDRQKFLRLAREHIFEYRVIARYSIRLTKQYVDCMAKYCQWETIVRLMWAGHQYIASLIDIDTVISAPQYIARKWLAYWIVDQHMCWDDCDMYVDSIGSVESAKWSSDDIEALLKQPIVDITATRQMVEQSKHLDIRLVESWYHSI